MNRRALFAFPHSLCLSVAVAVALAACGGSSPTDAVTGAPAATSAARVGALSKSDDKVPVCHRGEDKLIPSDALADHLGHGDAEGVCVCPCFSADHINTAASGCEAPNVLSVICDGDATSLSLSCAPAGPGSPGTSELSLYLSSPPPGLCARLEPLSSVSKTVTASHYQTCVNIIESSAEALGATCS